MRKIMTCVLLAVVISIALAARTPAGDATMIRNPNWLTVGHRFMTMEKAKIVPNPVAAAAKEELNRGCAKPWVVEWSNKTGLPTSVRGASERHEGPPTTIAADFVKRNLPLFTGRGSSSNQNDVSFHVERTLPNEDPRKLVVVVYLSESYKGIPVDGGIPGRAALLRVSVDESGRVVGVEGDLCEIGSPPTTPLLSPAQAVAALRLALSTDSIGVSGDARVLIYPCASPPRLAYLFEAGILGDGPYAVYVDASSGEPLEIVPMFTTEKHEKSLQSDSAITSPSPARRRVP